MRYLVFFICLIFFISIALSLFNMGIGQNYERLTNYGLGYIAGKVILMLGFLAACVFSGRSIVKQYFKEPIV